MNASFEKNTKRIFTFNNYSYIEYRKQKHLLAFTASLDIKRVDGSDIKNKGTYQIRYDYYKSKTFIPEVFFQVYTNTIANIDNRILVGGGPRFQFIKNDDLMMSIGTYLMYVYEHEDNDDAGLGTIYHNDIRACASYTLVYNLVKNISFKISAFYQPKINLMKDYRFDFFTRVSLKVYKNLDFNLSYVLNYDSYPAKDIPTTQYQFFNGLSYTFK
ncbi:DUF481 domain-containing protein [Formosa haliotis]|uniref:DUF481 domain-containing protein n=1 Tax=Formosa haliotis TaxID=1555194 RepID=UPI000826369C|nr:DUF481 domain-containing protein [Formosa haliotis]